MTAGKPLVILPAAGRDIDAATDYYFAEAGAPLATRWARALENTLRSVASRSAAGATRYAAVSAVKGLRVWQVSRFPYLVFYIETTHAISVIRVLHGSRDIPAMLQDVDNDEAGAVIQGD